MSYPKHLFLHNNHFYFKVRVPTDLQSYFPVSIIKKSLKTTDLAVAKEHLVTIEYHVTKVFTLLRSGLLDADMSQNLVNRIVQARRLTRTAEAKPLSVKSVSLSTAIKQYMELKEPEWTPKTKMEMTGVFRLIQEILGDMSVRDISRQTMLDLRANLLKLPSSRYKKYPEVSIQELLDREGINPMSIKTVNKHVGGINAVLRYCLDEGMIPANYASGLKISDKRRTDEERSSYTTRDLQQIFDNLPRCIRNPERYWIPLIGCWSGMRLNEICQLYVEDVQEVEGIWCFSVNGAKDKRLKNQSSERMVPIHPTLLELGLLQHVEQAKASCEPRMWKNLTWMDIHGYSNNFGKWYQRFNREYVTDDVKKVFHSFRHLVTDTLKQAGVQDAIIAELVGHSHGTHSMTMSRYGKRYQPKVLLEALRLLDYGVDILKWME